MGLHTDHDSHGQDSVLATLLFRFSCPEYHFHFQYRLHLVPSQGNLLLCAFFSSSSLPRVTTGRILAHRGHRALAQSLCRDFGNEDEVP